jgi:hypothetical protein
MVVWHPLMVAIAGVIVANDAHLFADTVTLQGGNATATGGAGGTASVTGNGGTGGDADASGGIVTVAYLESFGLGPSSAITNTAGSATAVGGVGGNGSPLLLGGEGGEAQSLGGNSIIVFAETTGAGAATIVNTGGDATATGGAGGNAGAGADGGDGGDAFATGGSAQINFFGTSSADTAVITNIAGVGIATAGTAGAPGVPAGLGGAGGIGDAVGGAAIVNFSENATRRSGQHHQQRGHVHHLCRRQYWRNGVSYQQRRRDTVSGPGRRTGCRHHQHHDRRPRRGAVRRDVHCRHCDHRQRRHRPVQ